MIYWGNKENLLGAAFKKYNPSYAQLKAAPVLEGPTSFEKDAIDHDGSNNDNKNNVNNIDNDNDNNNNIENNNNNINNKKTQKQQQKQQQHQQQRESEICSGWLRLEWRENVAAAALRRTISDLKGICVCVCVCVW